jgi:hypothetical protein
LFVLMTEREREGEGGREGDFMRRDIWVLVNVVHKSMREHNVPDQHRARPKPSTLKPKPEIVDINAKV